MIPFTRRRVSLPARAETGEIALLDFGDPARPVDVVLSHANGFNALSYRQALSPLSAELRIVAYDLRGHGLTSLPAPADEGVSWDIYRDDLLALLGAVNIENPLVLAGHSMGARASLMAADLSPERVKSLVLFDPVLPLPVREGDPPSPSIERLIRATNRRKARFESRQAAIDNWRGKGAFTTWPDEVLADYAEDGLTADDDGVHLACAPAWEAANFGASGGPALELLHRVRVPTQILKGEHGSTCRASSDDPEVKANPLINIETIPGTSHFLPMERPDLVQKALRSAAA